jgi:phosphate transport system substrate-binding protein
LTGKITNWKDVGGGDLPVVLVRVGITAGPHMAIEKDILQGAKIPATAKAMKGPKDVPNVVAQVPGAFGYIGSNNANDSVKIIATDCTVKMSMMLVTKGDPTATQRKFIDAAKAMLAAK